MMLSNFISRGVLLHVKILILVKKGGWGGEGGRRIETWRGGGEASLVTGMPILVIHNVRNVFKNSGPTSCFRIIL